MCLSYHNYYVISRESLQKTKIPYNYRKFVGLISYKQANLKSIPKRSKGKNEILKKAKK